MNRSRSAALFFAALAGAASLQGQASAVDAPAATVPYTAPQPLPSPTVAPVPQSTAKTAATPAANYVLGEGDQLTVFVTDLEEFNDKTFRVDGRGQLSLPLVGRVQASGLTVDQLQREVADHLLKIVKDPDVVINISEFHSQPVSVLGAVGTPGVRQIEGSKTLFEVLSMAGGLRSDAGNTINITRDLKWGAIPLPNAKTDPSGRFSVASVSVKSVLNARDPAQNITVQPNDIISVSQAEVVYAVGDVMKPGGFPVGQNEQLSALQVISLAEGVQRTAASDRAMILRVVPGTTERAHIPVNVKQLMAGKGHDVSLQANDILFVPDSKSKVVGTRTLDTIVSLATGMAVYGKY